MKISVNFQPSIFGTPASIIMKSIMKVLLRRSDKIIVSSKYLERRVQSIIKKTPYYIPNGVNISFFSKKISDKRNNFPIVGYVGGIYDWAGIEDFISTYPTVSKEIPDVQYHIYGTGDIANKIKKIAEKYEGVKFLGVVISYIKVPKVISEFTIGIIPFKKKILTDAVCPIKLFKYWAAKAAVISRNLVEIQDITSNSCLFFKTTDNLSNMLISTLLDRNMINRLVRNGLKEVKHFDWDNLAKKFFLIL